MPDTGNLSYRADPSGCVFWDLVAGADDKKAVGLEREGCVNESPNAKNAGRVQSDVKLEWVAVDLDFLVVVMAEREFVDGFHQYACSMTLA